MKVNDFVINEITKHVFRVKKIQGKIITLESEEGSKFKTTPELLKNFRILDTTQVKLKDNKTEA